MTKLSTEEYAALRRQGKSGRYGAVKPINGFDSTGEYRRYQELVLLQFAGKLCNLKTQVRYPLGINGKHICYHDVDFQYEEKDNLVVEDFKGHETDVWKIKYKMFLACYPEIEYRVTK